MRIILIAMFLMLAACAKDEKHADPFFRTWSGGSYGSLSFAGLHYGQNYAAFNGCQCTIGLYGGGYEVNQLSIRSCGPTSFTASPECTALNGEYTYTYSGSSLELCDAVTLACSVYY